jgi:hypothetical protein
MPVIVGVPRSGTTLLRVMLDAHPELAIPPETGFVLDACRLDGEGDELRKRLLDTITRFHTWGVMGVSASALQDRLRSIEPFDVAEGVRTFYRLYAARFGKWRFGDKTPMYRFHLEELETLLPEARFIHIIRDGRDVALSVRGFWFAPGEDIKTLAADWRTGIVATRAQGSLVKRYIELRFEDLIISPERELRRVPVPRARVRAADAALSGDRDRPPARDRGRQSGSQQPGAEARRASARPFAAGQVEARHEPTGEASIQAGRREAAPRAGVRVLKTTPATHPLSISSRSSSGTACSRSPSTRRRRSRSAA